MSVRDRREVAKQLRLCFGCVSNVDVDETEEDFEDNQFEEEAESMEQFLFQDLSQEELYHFEYESWVFMHDQYSLQWN